MIACTRYKEGTVPQGMIHASAEKRSAPDADGDCSGADEFTGSDGIRVSETPMKQHPGKPAKIPIQL
jgi:hypothetical protein